MSNDLVPAPDSDPPATNRDERWQFLRDVAVFEMKLALNNLHNFFQIPLTIAVAVFDLVAKGKTEGERFYKIVEVGRTIDDSIDIYSIIDHRDRVRHEAYTVDAMLAKVEGVIRSEYEKGGTTASIKAAVDRVIDGMQAKTAPSAAKVDDAVRAAADKLRETMRDFGGDAP